MFNYGDGEVYWLETGDGNSSNTDGGTKHYSGQGSVKVISDLDKLKANLYQLGYRNVYKDYTSARNQFLKDYLDNGHSLDSDFKRMGSGEHYSTLLSWTNKALAGKLTEKVGYHNWDNANIGGRKIFIVGNGYICIESNPGDSLNDIMYLLTGIKNYYTDDTAYKPNEKSKYSITINIDDYVTDSQLSIALGSVITKNGSDGFTRSQSVALGRLNNIITNHMKPSDFSGTELDLQGNPVPKPGGGTWNHMNEMNNSYEGLKSVRNTLEGSLKNPNLNPRVRQHIQEALNKTNSYMSQIETLYDKYDKTLGNDSNNGNPGSSGTGGGSSGGSGGTNPPITPIVPLVPGLPILPKLPVFEPIPMPVFP